MRRPLLPPIAALVLALVVTEGRAAADRYGRGEALFGQQCASCHTVGWGSPIQLAARPANVDLTGATARLDGHTLRRFLAEPAIERPGTGCRHGTLGREAVDDLVAFLEIRAEPHPGPQRVPPRSTMRKWSDPMKPRPPRAAPATPPPSRPAAAPPSSGGGR